MPVADLVKDIESGKLKAVTDRLKKEKGLATAKVADPKNKGPSHTPLHTAVKARALPMVEALLAAGADANAVDANGATPLHWMLYENAKEWPEGIAEALLKAKGKPGVADKSGATPLHIAAKAGAPGLPLLVAAAGPSSLEALCDGDTPLLAAARAGRLEAVRQLASSGARPGAADAAGRTPLLLLLRAGHLAAASALLQSAGGSECGVAAVDAEDRDTALAIACRHAARTGGAGAAGTAEDGAGGVAGSVAGGGDGDSSSSEWLGMVQALLAEGAPAEMQDPLTKDTLLMWALRERQSDLVALLLPATKNIDAVNAKKETALSVAISSGDDAAVSAVLLAKPSLGAAADAVRLMKGALADKRDAVAAALLPLLDENKVSLLDIDPRTMLAAGMPMTAHALLQRSNASKAGTDAAQHIDEDGNTLIHLAVTEVPAGCVYAAIAALIRAGVNPDAANKSEVNTAMHVAAKCGSVDACRALLDGGADPTKRNGKNRTPRSQPKIPDATKDFLLDKEDEFRKRKEEAKADLYGSKIAETQTQSAFGVRVM